MSQHSDKSTLVGLHTRMKELMVQSRHYAPQNRREAINGIHDLFKPSASDAQGGILDAPEFVELSLGSVSNELVALILDDNNTVRAALLACLDTYFKLISEHLAIAFGSVLVAYATSAMSHISDSVRVDGLKLFTLIMECFPLVVVVNASSVMPHFLHLMSSNAKMSSSNTSSALSGHSLPSSNGSRAKNEWVESKNRVKLLESLHDFLRLILDSTSDERQSGINRDDKPYSWDESVGFPLIGHSNRIISKEMKKYFCHYMTKSVFGEYSSKASNRVSVSLSFGSKKGKQLDSKNDAYSISPLGFFQSLYPTLLDFWIESSDIFASSKIHSLPHVTICNLVMSILSELCRSVKSTPSPIPPNAYNAFLSLLERHVSPQFPFGETSSIVETPGTESISRMLLKTNFSFCTLYLLASSQAPKLLVSITKYITRILKEASRNNRVAADAKDLFSQDVLYELCVVRLNEDILRSLIRFQVNTRCMESSHAAFKLLSTVAISNFERRRLDDGLEGSYNDLEKWKDTLGKQLLQLKSFNIEYTRDILDCMQSVLQRARLNEEVSSVLLDSIVALFGKCDNQDGSRKQFASSKSLDGIFVHQPEDIQNGLVYLLYYIPSWTSELIESVLNAVLTQSVSHSVRIALLDVAQARKHDLVVDKYGSILLSLILGCTTRSLKSDKSLQSKKQDASEIEYVLKTRDSMVNNCRFLIPWQQSMSSLLSIVREDTYSIPEDAMYGLLKLVLCFRHELRLERDLINAKVECMNIWLDSLSLTGIERFVGLE